MKIWEGYDFQLIYSACLNRLSDYLLSLDRKDIVPISDIVALFENIDGIDSVKVWFDADVNNAKVYNEEEFYGIDEQGDIILTRYFIDINGNEKRIRDILAIFRGGFTSPEGIEYSNVQTNDFYSGFNLTLVAYSHNRKLSLENYQTIT